ncbi:MAG: hypothetical protein ABI947_29160 [Chloroflexota bacterium]
MNNLPSSPDYDPRLDRAIQATRAAIEEALGFIKRQEDGPLTMTFALRDIDEQVDAIETEVWCVVVALDNMNEVVARLSHQRDEAMRQYNTLLSLFGLPTDES